MQTNLALDSKGKLYQTILSVDSYSQKEINKAKKYFKNIKIKILLLILILKIIIGISVTNTQM